MPGFEWIDEEEKNAVTSIFDEGGVLFAHGFDKIRKKYHVREFEKSFCESFDAKNALAVTSGTAAIKIGLKSLGVREGDEVITQSFNFIATIEAADFETVAAVKMAVEAQGVGTVDIFETVDINSIAEKAQKAMSNYTPPSE